MHKNLLKKLLTFQYSSDIINNVKRTDNSLLFPTFFHIERLTGRLRNTSDGFDSHHANSSTDVKRIKSKQTRRPKQWQEKEWLLVPLRVQK